MSDSNLLIITNYFPPETGAAANRIYAMATAFMNRGRKVSVVCPLPNYPTGVVHDEFKGKFKYATIEDGINVTRLWLWPSNSKNKVLRLLSMLSFSLSLLLFLIFTKTPKKIVVQYSPVFVGFTGVLISKLLGKKIILNVSDLWPLAGLEMGILQKGTYYSILERMETYCYNNSNLILGQSEEILQHVRERNASTSTALYRNYPDFLPPEIPPTTPSAKKEIHIAYAGLVGVAQGLSTIVSSVNIPDHIVFHIYGNGPDLEPLEAINNSNIVLHGSLSRYELHKTLLNYDMAFVPLVTRIYGSVPSKIFEYSRLGLPLLYMGGGEGGDIVRANKIGWVVESSDYKGLENFLNDISHTDISTLPKEVVRNRAITNFNFQEQFDRVDKLV